MTFKMESWISKLDAAARQERSSDEHELDRKLTTRVRLEFTGLTRLGYCYALQQCKVGDIFAES